MSSTTMIWINESGQGSVTGLQRKSIRQGAMRVCIRLHQSAKRMLYDYPEAPADI